MAACKQVTYAVNVEKKRWYHFTIKEFLSRFYLISVRLSVLSSFKTVMVV